MKDTNKPNLVRFRTPYNWDAAIDGVSFATEGESLTTQDAKDDCDVNMILERMARSGLDPHESRKAQAQYGDWTQFPSNYQEAYNQVLQAQETFSQLPSQIRENFNNDPLQFLNYATNPQNLPKLVEMGLATKIPEPEKPLEEKMATAFSKALEAKPPKPNKQGD